MQRQGSPPRLWPHVRLNPEPVFKRHPVTICSLFLENILILFGPIHQRQSSLSPQLSGSARGKDQSVKERINSAKGEVQPGKDIVESTL
jgi:hypothetical protein